MRIDSPISCNAIITGSFTGSFKGDGSQLTGVTAEWDGSHTGNASIDGDLTVSNLITAGNVDGVDVSQLKTDFDVDSAKLAGIEAGATEDQTGAEIKALYEAEDNAFTDAQFTKLAGLEVGATGDQTGAEIKALYEGEADTNAFDDAAVAKLGGIEAGATGDQTAAEIKAAYESNADTNAFDDDAVSKLAGIEAGATNDTAELSTLSGRVTDVEGDVTAILAASDADKDSFAEIVSLINSIDTENDSALGGHVSNTNNPHSVTKAQVGLGSVDNTSDAAKPISTAVATALAGKQAAGTYNTIIGTDSDISYAGATVLSAMTMTDGVVQSHSSRTLTLANLGYTGATNANYITNNNQLTNGAGYITSYVNTTYSAGSGLGLSGTTFSHSDTSTQASVNNSGRTYIQDITLDGFGHVTGIASATETVVNTDTNTTYTAGNGLTLSGTQFLMSGTYTGNFSATGNITAYSDSRLKKDVKTIEGALDKTKALRGVEFTRIEDDAKSIGVIAQELEAVLPELVLTDDEGMKSVNYAQITGLLIEAVKELSAKVDELSK